MPPWLQPSAGADPLGGYELALRLGWAAAFGLFVASVYFVTQRRPAGPSPALLTTLVLLTMLVAMTTIVIGDSIARAFGLVGALSIVRFRTVVEDTRDTSFVIFAVVVGMAVGAGNLAVCVVGVPAVGAAAGLMSLLDRRMPGSSVRRLEIRVAAGRDPVPLLTQVLNDHVPNRKPASAGSARQGASLDLVYLVRLRDAEAMLPAVRAIGSIDGVQSVEFKEP